MYLYFYFLEENYVLFILKTKPLGKYITVLKEQTDNIIISSTKLVKRQGPYQNDKGPELGQEQHM